MNVSIGEIAALITAFCFAASSVFFTAAGRRLGSQVTNRTRLVVATILLMLVHWLALGSPLPLDAAPERWFWLGLSGIIGLAIGDAFLFQAYVSIGPRLGLLLLSFSPALSTILAWLLLGEALGLGQLLGILITMTGIMWVVLDRKANGNGTGQHPLKDLLQDKHYRNGILFGLGGAVGQAFGLTLAKNGLGGDFPAISGTLMRMSLATIVFWGLTAAQKQVRPTFEKIRSVPKGLWYVLGGAIIGPVTGVTFSLYAVQHSPVGVASAIMALPPVILLPVSRFILKEQFGWGAVWGTLLAVAGVVILFLL